MSKHTLIAAGAAHDENADRLFSNTTSGVGRALCSCGWLSEPVEFGRQRKRLHEEHVKASAASAIETSPNGVEHAVVNGHCVTCGKDHSDWSPTHAELDEIAAEIADIQNDIVEANALLDNAAPWNDPEHDVVADIKAGREAASGPEHDGQVPYGTRVVEWPKHIPLTSFKAMGNIGASAIAEACGAASEGVASKGIVTLTGDLPNLDKLAELLPKVWDTANNALKAWRKTSPEYKQHNLRTSEGYRNGYLAERAYLRDYCMGVAVNLFGAQIGLIDGETTGYRAGLLFPELPQVEPWETGCRAVIARVFAERQAQVAKYGSNDGVCDGTGPEVRWLLPYTSKSATDIEADLRADYIAYEDEVGAPSWVHLIREEVAEAFIESDPERLAGELIQVAALCVSWVEQLTKRGAKPVLVRDPEGLL